MIENEEITTGTTGGTPVDGTAEPVGDVPQDAAAAPHLRRKLRGKTVEAGESENQGGDNRMHRCTETPEVFKAKQMPRTDAAEKGGPPRVGSAQEDMVLDCAKKSMWHVGSVLEAARKSAWVAATDCENAGQPELAKKLDAIADFAGTVEVQMKALYCQTYGMVRPKTDI